MKGCLTGLSIFVVLVVAGVLLLWSQRESILTGLEDVFELPDYGTGQYINPRFGDQLMAIRAAADASGSLFQFGAAVETMDLPAEYLYVGTEQGDEKVDIIKRFDWSGHSLVSSGDYGAGTLSRDKVNRRIMTWKQEGNWSYMDRFSVYIEYTGEADGAKARAPDVPRLRGTADLHPERQ